jgi:hypothetical protein
MTEPLMPNDTRPVSGRRSGRGDWRWILPVAVVHYLQSMVLLLFAYSSWMADFDPGSPRAAAKSPAIEWAYRVVSLPLTPLLLRGGLRVPHLLRRVAPFANSLIWGCGVWLLLKVYRRVRAGR